MGDTDEKVKVERDTMMEGLEKSERGYFKILCREEGRQAVGSFSQHDLYQPFATRQQNTV